MHNTLCINLGSTTAKYSYFQGKKDIQRIANFHFETTAKGLEVQNINYRTNKESIEVFSSKTGEEIFQLVLKFLKDNKFIDSIKDIHSICVRVVHGGNDFPQATQITLDNIGILERIQDLAPLHNPNSYALIKDILSLNSCPKVFAVFDTSFHVSIPKHVSHYAIPQNWTKDFTVKKFGFHGIALESVMQKMQKKYKKIPEKIVVCHLGGGCSATAIFNGKSLDTSMSFSPLDGLMMVSRSGSFDLGAVDYLMKKTQLPYDEILYILNNKSGLKALAKTDNIELIIKNALQGDTKCKLALDMFCYQVMKYIYAYYGSLQGIDCLVFSGGIGEGSEVIRKKICDSLKAINIFLDSDKNKNLSSIEINEIQLKKSQARILIVHPEEDREMLRQVL